MDQPLPAGRHRAVLLLTLRYPVSVLW
jgi:hypothetical protein